MLNFEKDNEVRWRVIEALGIIGDKRAVKTLVDLLSDNEPEIRWRAVKSLGIIKDSDSLIFILKAIYNKDQIC